jgi:hypothetical protein
MGDDARTKLEEFCRQNMIRIEVYAGNGYGTMTVEFTDDINNAVVNVESEET